MPGIVVDLPLRVLLFFALPHAPAPPPELQALLPPRWAALPRRSAQFLQVARAAHQRAGQRPCANPQCPEAAQVQVHGAGADVAPAGHGDDGPPAPGQPRPHANRQFWVHLERSI